MITPIMRRLLAVALVVAPSPVFCGSVTLHPELTEADTDSWVEPAINASYRLHAVAASRWLLAIAGSGDALTEREFKDFSRPFLSGTFLSARYVWIDARTGEQHSRIYHASSVRENPWLPGRIHPASPYTAYFAEDAGATRATLRSAEGSRVTHTDVGDRHPDARQGDAEVRLLRTLEADLRSGAVGERGRLSVFVSTKVCDSCEIALQRFASDEDVDIQVHPLSRDPESSIRKAFRRRRKDMMDNLECDLALRKGPAGTSSTTPGSRGDAARLLPFGCAGVSVY